MPAYIVATVNIHDPQRFAEYGKLVAGLSEAYGGTPVVRGVVGEFLEGTGLVGERVVVTQFADAAAARAYISSQRYQAARAVREGAADITMRLVEA